MREYPERPIVGVGAIVIHDDRILLIRRGNEPLKGEWSVPGGAVECGETLEAAIAREVREETGLDVEVGPIVDVIDRIRLDSAGRPQYHYVLIDYVCRLTGGTLRCGSDAVDARWADLDEVAALGVSPATISVIRKAFDMRSVRR